MRRARSDEGALILGEDPQMTLKERISAATKDAMRNKETKRLATLRLINAAIKDREIAMRGSDDEAELTEADILAILSKMVKQRQESAKAYEEGGRFDLAEAETAEIEIIQGFLPKALNDEEIGQAIEGAVAEAGATALKDMGAVMAILKGKYTGQIDFAKAGPMVKARLSQ